MDSRGSPWIERVRIYCAELLLKIRKYFNKTSVDADLQFLKNSKIKLDLDLISVIEKYSKIPKEEAYKILPRIRKMYQGFILFLAGSVLFVIYLLQTRPYVPNWLKWSGGIYCFLGTICVAFLIQKLTRLGKAYEELKAKPELFKQESEEEDD